MVNLRRYTKNDCATLMNLFYETIHNINIKDYTEDEVFAWTDGVFDYKIWNERFLKSYTIIAEIDGLITGFGNIDNNGYLDCLYVHKDYQRKGIATVICDELEKSVVQQIYANVSITAKPFFEKRGYIVIEKQLVQRKGLKIINYKMKKDLNEMKDI